MQHEDYEENWAVYLSPIEEDRIGSVIVDLGFSNIAPVEEKPILTTVITFMNNPNEDGLSSDVEFETLNEVEDYFINLITTKFDCFYVGRLKYDGKVFSYFYSDKNYKYESFFAKTSRQFPNYHFDYNNKEDKVCKVYFEVLYPSPFEMQVIQNNLVIENLERHGDKLEVERQVDHWIYFQSESDRESFLKSIEEEEFEVVNKDETSLDDRPFQLQISRLDKADYESVNEYVMYLWQTAQEFNGDYDGWETFIVKD